MLKSATTTLLLLVPTLDRSRCVRLCSLFAAFTPLFAGCIKVLKRDSFEILGFCDCDFDQSVLLEMLLHFFDQKDGEES